MSNQNDQNSKSGTSQQNQPKQTGTSDQQNKQKQAAQHSDEDNSPGETETGARDKTAE